MKKYLLTTILAFTFQYANSDDFTWGEEFKEGDTISAEVFNQIFTTIEKINRTVVDTDLIGTWNCDATTTRATTGYVDKGSFYLLEDAQLNLTSSGASTSFETPYNITTSTPSPLKRENAAFIGTYQLYKNMLFLKQNGDSNPRVYAVDIVSNSRIELTFLETSALSFPASYSSFVVCDTTAILSNPPTDMTATQNGSSITIGWTDNSSDETGFKIYKRTSSESAYTSLVTLDSNVTTYNDSAVTEGTEYYYAVSSVNQNGESRKTNPVSIVLDGTPPTVTSVSPAANSTVSIDYDKKLVVTFSEEIKYTSPGGIYGVQAKFTWGSNEISYSEVTEDFGSYGTGSIFTFTLAGGAGCLKAGTTVSIVVDASYIQDINGNDMANDFTYTYNVGNTAINSESWSACGQSE